MIIVWRCLVNGSSNVRDIDVDDLLFFGIENRTEVKGERVLRIVHVRSIIHECLL